jgi:fructokinase
MPIIITQGECLIDIVFENRQPVYAMAGGSVFNASISLGRAGAHVEFIGEFSNDAAGKLIIKALTENKVRYSCSRINTTGHTSLAIASLDENRNASYDFYHIPAYDKQVSQKPQFNDGDFFLFGSAFALKDSYQDWLELSLAQAGKHQVIIYYDPNIRRNHIHEFPDLTNRVLRNIRRSNIVKGSEEDFASIFGTTDPLSIYKRVKEHCPILLVSQGSRDVHLFTPAAEYRFNVPEIRPVSTIGAGDNFNAGILFALQKRSVLPSQLASLTETEWDSIVNTGIQFAMACCLNVENYIPVGFSCRD